MQLKKAEGREGVCRMRVENFVEALEADFFCRGAGFAVEATEQLSDG